MLIEHYTRSRCQEVCEYFEHCYGYQYSSHDERCEIWHEAPIDRKGLRFSYGTDCYMRDPYYEPDDDDYDGEDDDEPDLDDEADDDDGEDDDEEDDGEPEPDETLPEDDDLAVEAILDMMEESCIESCKRKGLSSKKERQCIRECKKTYGSYSSGSRDTKRSADRAAGGGLFGD